MRLSGMLLGCLAVLAGCDSNPTQPTPATCTFTLNTTTVTVGPAGGAGSISVTTGSSCTWTARSDVSWVTATSGTSGTGSGTFAFSVSAAPDTNARTGAMTVAGQPVSVTQQGLACTYALSSTSQSFGATGGAGSISVTTGSSCTWTARSDVSWVTATSGTSGTGSGTFAFSVSAAPDTNARTGAMTVAGQPVSVTQQGLACSYALSSTSQSFGASGGTASFSVSASAGCAWTAVSSAPWLTVSAGASGSGSGTITIAVAANPAAPSRTGTLTVADQTYTVTQGGVAACTVTLDRDHDTLSVAGGSGHFDVTAPSGCAWAATSDVSWIRVTDPAGGLGAGSRRVLYVVDASGNAATRTGTISVSEKAVVITQAGTASCAYSVAPTDVRACMAEGFGRRVDVSTDPGCPWTASTSASWISIASGLSGTGPGSITYSLGADYDAARQGIIEVRWPTPTAGQNVRVSQAGCNYAFEPDTFDIPSSGGDFLVYVISGSTDSECGGRADENCVWSAQSHASWITVLSSMPRRGWDRVSFRVAANGTGASRAATITVGDKTFLIRQAGI